jgi:hypothetical protein
LKRRRQDGDDDGDDRREDETTATTATATRAGKDNDHNVDHDVFNSGDGDDDRVILQ